MGLGKIISNIILFIFLFSFNPAAQAQDSLKKTPEQATQSVPTPSPNSGINNPTLTVPPVIRPLEDFTPPPRPRKRRLTAADSALLAAKNDSLLRVQRASINTTLGATQIPIPKTDSMGPQANMSNMPEVPVLTQSDNPFEILRGAATTDSLATNAQKTSDINSSLLERRVYSKNFLFWVFLITLILMAFVVANARTMIGNAYVTVISNNALRLANKESFGWNNIIYIALYVLFWINAGIFTFLLLGYFGIRPAHSQTLTLLSCIGGVALVFLIKHIILFVISYVFPLDKEMKTYNFIILTGGILLGLILMPLNIFIAYTPTGLSEIFVYFTFGIIGLVYLVRSLRSLTLASPYFLENKFHFLLYICAAEIAPLMVLAKIILSGMK